MFSDHNGIKLTANNRETQENLQTHCKLNDTLLNNPLSQRGSFQDNQKYIELNESGNTTYLWHMAKVVSGKRESYKTNCMH